MLLVALNGYSSRDAEPILIDYYLIVVLGNLLAATLANLPLRRLRPLASGLTQLHAVAVTGLLMVAGPPLAVALMKIIF